MIRLTKYDASHDVHGKAIAWLNGRRTKYRIARKSGDPCQRFERDYRKKRVKDALLDETHKKCAYCESRYRAVASGDVDHVLPRINDPDRLLDYENLTLACPLCNNRKSAYEDPALPLLDPYDEDPEKRLTAVGASIIPVPGTDADQRAYNTIVLLELNLRTELAQRRDKAVQEVVRLFNDYLIAPTMPLKNSARRQIEEMASPCGEYALVVRNVIQHMKAVVQVEETFW